MRAYKHLINRMFRVYEAFRSGGDAALAYNTYNGMPRESDLVEGIFVVIQILTGDSVSVMRTVYLLASLLLSTNHEYHF